jgi:hypothetical protein
MAWGSFSGSSGILSHNEVVIVDGSNGGELAGTTVSPAFAPEPHSQEEYEKEDEAKDAGNNYTNELAPGKSPS